jgi:hypothetical protein
MLHDLVIVTVFVAMLLAPCLMTLRSQGAEDDAPDAPHQSIA